MTTNGTRSVSKTNATTVFPFFVGTFRSIHRGAKPSNCPGEFKDLNYEEPPQNNTDNQNALKVKQNQEKTKEPKKVIGSVYKLGSVLKDYLVKRNKKLVKIDKKFKYDPEQRVRLNLTGNYTEVINSLKTQGIIDTKPGDCQNCIIIIAPGAKK